MESICDVIYFDGHFYKVSSLPACMTYAPCNLYMRVVLNNVTALYKIAIRADMFAPSFDASKYIFTCYTVTSHVSFQPFLS
jgi:hypothetical protein